MLFALFSVWVWRCAMLSPQQMAVWEKFIVDGVNPDGTFNEPVKMAMNVFGTPPVHEYWWTLKKC